MITVLGRNVYKDRASQILAIVNEEEVEGSVIEEIRALGIEGEVRSWREYSGLMGGMVSSFEIITSLINGIGLVVAGIVMFIVIYINVINRKRQIGILRAIGIKREVIVASYLIQALFYAVLGIIFGGLAFGYGIQPYFDLNPIDLAIGQVSLVIKSITVQYAIFGLIFAALLAGLIPVLSITRQGIIQAIWEN
jgi:putative ABC transport system permease protein